MYLDAVGRGVVGRGVVGRDTVPGALERGAVERGAVVSGAVERGWPDVVLRTGRLVLWSPRDADAEAIVLGVSDEVTRRWLPLPWPYAREQAIEFIRETAPVKLADDSGLVRAIETAGGFAGLIDLKRTDWRHRETEIGYWAMPHARGVGVMTEAVTALARWVLNDCRFERVVLRVAPGNAASARVAIKAGFTAEGIARNAGITYGGRVDLAIYSLIPSDLAR